VAEKSGARGPVKPGGDLLRIGRVARAVGLKGQLEIRLDWSDSRALLDAAHVELALRDGSTERRAIAGTRQTHKGVIVQLEGVCDRDAAEARSGAGVSVLRSDLPPLVEGEYYLCDLAGLAVSGPDGPLGQVLEVQMYPSVDAIVIEAPSGELFEQPLLSEWLERVDVTAGVVVLRSLGGLLELSRPGKRTATEAAPAGADES
jgi:16S rRNA processing protein RimM